MARPREFNEIEIKQFKGLDLRGPPELTPLNTFQTLTNFEIGYAGELKKRPGIRRQHNGSVLGANGVKFLGEYSTNNFHHLLVQSEVSAQSGKVYICSDSALNWSQASTPVSSLYQCAKGVQYNGVFYIPTTLTGHIFTWNGTAWTDTNVAGNPATQLKPVILQDRMFLIERTSLNIRYSETLQMTNHPANNSIAYSKTEDKDYPVGLIGYRDRLIILRQNSMQALYLNGLPTSWVMKTIPFNIGVANENCAVVYNDLLYLICLDGVFRTDLTSIDEISKPLAPLFYQRRKTAFQTSSTSSDAIGVWNGRLFCSMRMGPSECRMFIYNIDTQTWSEYLPNMPSGIGYAYSPVRDFQTVNIARRSGSATIITEGVYFTTFDPLGKIFLFDDQNITYSDENGAFTSVAKTRNINGDASEDMKRVYSMSVRGKKGTAASITGQFNVNGTDGATFPVSLDATTKQSRFKGPGYFREAALSLTDTDTTALEIEAISAHGKRKESISELKT
jgi:hypothetical protein